MTRKWILAWAAAVIISAALCFSAWHSLANQSNTFSPTVGTVSGLQLTTNYNNAFSALQSCNSGGVAPTNDQTAAPVQGQCWLNTSTSPFTAQQYDGTQWVTIGWLDTTNHQWIGNNAGGTGTIASASTTDLGTVRNPVISISGTTTINSFGSSALTGSTRFLNFTGALTLTNNATSLILPNGGANITTAAGDTAIATYLGSGNWRVISYTKAGGLGVGSVTASFLANSAIPYAIPCLNCTITSSVATNALTVSLKTLAGANPSNLDPVSFLVPNGTGGFTVTQVTSAMSVTIPSGATAGTVSAQANRIWVGFFPNAGSPVLGIYNSLNGTNVLPWDDTSTAVGTLISGTSNSSQTWYTASGVAASNYRVIAYVESTQATAGTWASSPTKSQMFGLGVKKPGEFAQEVPAFISSSNTVTTSTYAAVSGINVSITPISAANVLRVEATGQMSIAVGESFQVRMSRGTTNNTGMFGSENGGGGQGFSAGFLAGTIALLGYDIPGAGSTTYAVQAKSVGAPTMTVGPNTQMMVREIQI